MTHVLCLVVVLLSSVAGGEDGARCRVTLTGRVTVDCTSQSITDLPITTLMNVHRLILTRNTIIHVPAYAFARYENLTSLDLSHNSIYTLDKYAFRGLFRLRELNLNSNRLHLGYAAIPRGLFDDCKNSLRELLLSRYDSFYGGENLAEYPAQYPTDSLAPLKQLRVLSLSPLNEFAIPEGFTALVGLRFLDFNHGSLRRLTPQNVDVARRMNITSISFRYVGLESIDIGTFANFPNLRAVNFACNTGLFYNKAIRVLGALNDSNIHTVILDRSTSQSSVLDPSIFCKTKFWRGVRRISLRANTIRHILQPWIFCSTKLQYLSLAYNAITPKMREWADYWLSGPTSVARIATLDLSYYTQSPGMQFDNDICLSSQLPRLYDPDEYFMRIANYDEPTERKNATAVVLSANPEDYPAAWMSYVAILKNLHITHWHNMWRADFWGNTLFDIGPMNLTFINISYSVFSKKVYFIPVGLNKLLTLDASHGKLQYIRPDMFSYMTALKSLNISHHELGVATDIRRLLQPLRELVELDLSHNALKSVDGLLFNCCSLMRNLVLAGNGLTAIYLDWNKLPHLESLDLRDNHFASLDADFRWHLDQLASASVRLLSLDLRNNSLLCNCDTMDSVRWLQTTNVHIVARDELLCRLPNGSDELLHRITDGDPRLRCFDDSTVFYIILSSSLSAVLAVSIALVTRYHRWYIIYHMKLYNVRRRRRRRGFIDDQGIAVTRDAMVVYFMYPTLEELWPANTAVSEWVCQCLQSRAENEWGASLYISERDDLVGVAKTENFIYGVSISNKLIICLTPALLGDQLLNNSFNMALAARRMPLSSYIFVSFEECDPLLLSSSGFSLKHLLTDNSPAVHLNWAAVKDNSEAEKKFWHQLRTALLDDEKQRICMSHNICDT